MLAAAPRARRADEVYVGRSFSEAKRVASVLDAALFVVSAGLGIVSASEMVPGYDLTVVDGTNSIRSLLKTQGKKTSDWWALLTKDDVRQRSLRSVVQQNPDSLVLVALPSSYLQMVVEDIESLSDSEVDRVRIFTSSSGRSSVSERIRKVVLPYDERLEGSLFPGTRNDFAQRALRHFIESLSGHRLSLKKSHEAVARALMAMSSRQLPTRVRKTDDEIRMLLEQNWIDFGGSSTRLLRYLRDDALVACEQSRFRNLWLSVGQDLTKGLK